MPDSVNPADLGQLIEGEVVKVSEGRFVIRTVDHQGKEVIFDPQEAMAQYEGKQVRFTLASFEGLEQLRAMLEKLGGAEGVEPLDLRRELRGDPTG